MKTKFKKWDLVCPVWDYETILMVLKTRRVKNISGENICQLLLDIPNSSKNGYGLASTWIHEDWYIAIESVAAITLSR